MSRASGCIFKTAIVLSVILAIASVAAACWTTKSQFPLEEGIRFGNKEIYGYRVGADFRIAFLPPFPIFRLRAYVPTAEQLAREDQAWGCPNHWLKIPKCSFSLWWPFAFSLVMPAIWFSRKRRRTGPGFPVEPIRRDP
jgi:hypothetical protein